MSQDRFLGLQWRLAAVYLVASLLGSGMVAAGYLAGRSLGLEPTPALGVGIGAGFAVGLIGSFWGVMLARSIKLRLWDAGDMATRIARGDFTTRLSVGRPDEIGLLEEQLNSMAGYLEQAVGQLRTLAEQNRQLAEEAGRGAALEERARLARDLHDTVNQQLFVLSLRAAAARKKLEKAGTAGDAMVAELQALEELSRQAHAQTRELILQLRPTTLEQQGLGPALEEYVKAAAAREGWVVQTAIDPSIRTGGKVGEALFRIAQEALNNVAKHAKASSVDVALVREEGALTLRLADDGRGFDRRAGVKPTSVGLVGMQERVAALGGQLRIRSAPAEGTEITVTVPVAATSTDDRQGGTSA